MVLHVVLVWFQMAFIVYSIFESIKNFFYTPVLILILFSIKVLNTLIDQCFPVQYLTLGCTRGAVKVLFNFFKSIYC